MIFTQRNINKRQGAKTMADLKKTVKVYKQRALVMTIPVVFLKALGIEIGTKLDLSFDEDKQAMIVQKSLDQSDPEPKTMKNKEQEEK